MTRRLTRACSGRRRVAAEGPGGWPTRIMAAATRSLTTALLSVSWPLRLCAHEPVLGRERYAKRSRRLIAC